MKLVDEGLKIIFEKAKITDVIKAYGYMRTSGCYTRAESMSNALYYFDIETINDYDLMITREYKDNTKSLEFYKLADVPHLEEYIAFCLTHKNDDGIPQMDIHEDAYVLAVAFEEGNEIDTRFLLKDFKGMLMHKYESGDRHTVIDGVIHDGDMRDDDGIIDMNEPEEPRRWNNGGEIVEEELIQEANGDAFRRVRLANGTVRDIYNNGRMVEHGTGVNDDTEEIEMGEDEYGMEEDVVADGTYIGEAVTANVTDGYFRPTNNIDIDHGALTELLVESTNPFREARNAAGEPADEVQERIDSLLTNIESIQRLLNNR
jgi:hypothetical protein